MGIDVCPVTEGREVFRNDFASARMGSGDWSAKAAATDLCTSASMARASGAGVGFDSSPQAANAKVKRLITREIGLPETLIIAVPPEECLE